MVSPQGVFVVYGHHTAGVVFLLAPHGGGVMVCEVSTATNKGMMQRMWQGWVSSRLATSIVVIGHFVTVSEMHHGSIYHNNRYYLEMYTNHKT